MEINSRRRFPKVAAISIIVLAALVVLGAFIYFSPKTKAPAERATKAKVHSSSSQLIKLVASGDELPHDSVNLNAKTTSGYDYTPFFSNVKPVFESADIRFCNQEVPSAAPAAGSVSGYPTFNAPTEFAHDLSAAGCNLINVATNHANDKGQDGINTTLDTWDSLPKLAIAGANRSVNEQQKVRYFKIKGVLFAFLAYNYETNNKNLTSYGVNMFDENLMTKQLAEANSKDAYTIVSVHWGTEDSPDIDANQEKWSIFLADHGADLVLGTGPHVLEPVKKISRFGGQALVWYSLGNMLNTQLDVGGLVNGFAVMNFEVKDNKPYMKSLGFLPTYMHYEWTPQQKAQQDLLARKNLKIYFLDKAADPLAKSQNNTTVEVQRERVKTVLNKYMTVPILSSDHY